MREDCAMRLCNSWRERSSLCSELRLQATALEDRPHACDDLLGAQRLDQIVGRACAHRFDGAVDAREAGHQHHIGARVQAPHVVQQLHPVHVGHADVGEHDGDRFGRQVRQRAARVAGLAHAEAFGLQHVHERFQHDALVVHNQDAFHGANQRWVSSSARERVRP
jgi:hypothetical protein